jgi:hypothetical protein
MRPFTDILREMRKGAVVDELTDQLATVVRGVLATDKPGAVTLTLTVKPQGKGDNAMIIAAKVGVKEPRDDLPDSIFFADDDGDLHRNDPTQQRMFADAEAGLDAAPEPPRRGRTRGD